MTVTCGTEQSTAAVILGSDGTGVAVGVGFGVAVGEGVGVAVGVEDGVALADAVGVEVAARTVPLPNGAVAPATATNKANVSSTSHGRRHITDIAIPPVSCSTTSHCAMTMFLTAAPTFSY